MPVIRIISARDEIHDAWLQLDACFEPPLTQLGFFEDLMQKYAAFGTTLICDGGGVLLGCVSFYANDVRTRIGYISHIATAEMARGRGIGSLLIEHAEMIAANRGMARMRLEVQKSNTYAQAFYKRHGYTLAEVRENSYLLDKALV